MVEVRCCARIWPSFLYFPAKTFLLYLSLIKKNKSKHTVDTLYNKIHEHFQELASPSPSPWAGVLSATCSLAQERKTAASSIVRCGSSRGVRLLLGQT
jgi:hypothetical protein